MDDLREMVLEKGQTSKDRRTVMDVLGRIKTPGDALFLLQAYRDAATGYKFYDALAMWLGQEKFWKAKTRSWLKELAKKYINGEI